MQSLKLSVSVFFIYALFLTIFSPLFAQAAATIRCESWNFRYTECGSDISQAWVAKQLSSMPCRKGENFGVNDGHIWVKDGCRADFEVNYSSEALSVAVKGNGYGWVSSNPPGIRCDGHWAPWNQAPCSTSYPSHSTVILEGKSGSDSSFTGWSGACRGTGTCQIFMDKDTYVTATFTKMSGVTSIVSKLLLTPSFSSPFLATTTLVNVLVDVPFSTNQLFLLSLSDVGSSVSSNSIGSALVATDFFSPVYLLDANDVIYGIGRSIPGQSEVYRDSQS